MSTLISSVLVLLVKKSGIVHELPMAGKEADTADLRFPSRVNALMRFVKAAHTCGDEFLRKDLSDLCQKHSLKKQLLPLLAGY
jgi:hypothetical protein